MFSKKNKVLKYIVIIALVLLVIYAIIKAVGVEYFASTDDWKNWDSPYSVDISYLRPVRIPNFPLSILNEFTYKFKDNQGRFNFNPFKIVTAQYLKDNKMLGDGERIYSKDKNVWIRMYQILIPQTSKWAPFGDLFIATPRDKYDPDLSQIPVALIRNEEPYSTQIPFDAFKWISDSYKCNEPDQLSWWDIEYVNQKYVPLGTVISRYSKTDNPLLERNKKFNNKFAMVVVNKLFINRQGTADKDARWAVGSENSKCHSDHWFSYSTPFFTMRVNSNNSGWWNSNRGYYDIVPADAYEKIDRLQDILLSAEDKRIRAQIAPGLAKRPQQIYPDSKISQQQALFSRADMKYIAKKYAPMCILHKKEDFFPTSVDFYLNYVKPVWKQSPDDDNKYVIALETREPLSSDTKILPFFGGEQPITNQYGKKESRVESYASVVELDNGDIQITYNFMFAYNWGKYACVGLDVANNVIDTLGNEPFRYSNSNTSFDNMTSQDHFNYMKYCQQAYSKMNPDRGMQFINNNKEFFRFMQERYNIFDTIGDAFKKGYDVVSDYASKGFDAVKSGVNYVADKAAYAVTHPLATIEWTGNLLYDVATNTPEIIKNIITHACAGKRYRFGNHVGDIEGCTLFLTKDLAPIKLYFGAHDFNYVYSYQTGKTYDAKDKKDLSAADQAKFEALIKQYPKLAFSNANKYLVEMSNEKSLQFVNDKGEIAKGGTHPVLFLAYGSHGTWGNAGVHDYTPPQSGFKKLATGISGLKLQDYTSNMSEGIKWMTWKDLRVFSPEEWSGQVPIESDLTKYGITNWITQVNRWGNLKTEGGEIAGQKELESGPSGFGRKYGSYVDWNKSLLRSNKTETGQANINQLIMKSIM